MVIVAVVWVPNDHRKSIAVWAASRGETLKEAELRAMFTGPYLPVRGSYCYRVTTNKGVYWFRWMFGRTIKQEVSEGKYITLED